MIIAGLACLGRLTLDSLARLGRMCLFAAQGCFWGFIPPFYPRLVLTQFKEIGFFSLPVVGMTALFTGMVLALQSYTGFSRFNGESAIATVVVLSMTRELGPVLAGLMVAGRSGAAIAAEIGTMRVTEQIDALVTLSTDPLRYLVWPRLVAALVMLPLLVLIADILGVLGGFLVGVYQLDFNAALYLHKTIEFLKPMDVISGLIKAATFGFLIALMGCYHGYHAQGGAAGVGTAVTKAVVSASVMILLSNYLLTAVLFDK